jgi:hypothetical protein
MAITVINLSDPVSDLVTKTNIISGDLGDIALLTSGDSNAVDAINQLIARPTTDSAQVVSLARGSLSVDNTNGGAITLSYDSSSGSIGISNSLGSTTTISYDSAAANFSLVDSSVSSVKLKDTVSLRIFDASGTAVKTIFGAGS